MKINPYLVFNGNCAEAMQFYNGVHAGPARGNEGHVGDAAL